MNMNNSEYKHEYKIFQAIWSLLNKQKHQPSAGWDSLLKKKPDLKELNKQIFFPLTPLHLYRNRKESLLTKTSIAYLNSVHPTKLRVNLNEAPSTKLPGLRVAPSISSDVIYEYLKTFSKYSDRKNGVLINYNQHIAYNFNSKNLLLRGVEPLINNSLKVKTNKNTPRPPFANTHRTEEPNAPTRVHRETPQDLLLRLNRLKGVSGETGYNRKGNNRLIKYSYKLLFYFFKSMYCLISKPVFLFTPDKVVIQLLYFINIPKFKVFKWYSIFRIRNKQIQKRKSLEKDKFKLHSVAELAQELNHNKNLSSIHTFNSDGRKKTKTKNKNQKVNWKVARSLIRLNKKRTKVKNILFNLNKYNLFRIFSLKFKLICEILNNKFKKPVELQLIRIHQPYQDSNILVNLLSLNIKNKKFKTNVKIEKLFQKRVVKNVYDYQNKSVNFIPAYLSGINIRIGGRLMREALIPRISKKRFERGARSIGKVNYLDSASITNKNRKGSYTLKISSGQNFF